jgi:cytochrome c551/c552
MEQLNQKIASENACITCGTTPLTSSTIASENACITCGTTPLTSSIQEK